MCRDSEIRPREALNALGFQKKYGQTRYFVVSLSIQSTHSVKDS